MIAFGGMLLALYIGASGIRLRWHGLAFLVVGAAAVGALATVAPISDPFVNSAAGFRIEAGWIAAGITRLFLEMLLWFGIGVALRSVARALLRIMRERRGGAE